MQILYNSLIYLAQGVLYLIALFSKKIRLFVNGRTDVFRLLDDKISPSDRTIWFHCASLGEFEQGVPVIEAIKKEYPKHKIVVSFFSPSGYENKKNTPLADVVVYLPLDTPRNAKRFIRAVHPSLVFFVKYEFWPNYLFEIQRQSIPLYLISGVFRPDQVFFKRHGGFMRKALSTFDYFFVQEKQSQSLLNHIGFDNVSISGDTRFDRVWEQRNRDNYLAFASEFVGDSQCIVYGSTWPEDEDILLNFVNHIAKGVKIIIAPHQIEVEKIDVLAKKITRKFLRHSEITNQNLAEYDVLVIDCIGLLGRLYSYAHIAYVGGAAGKTGLHNILEPATFGIPIVIGKNYDGFPEAYALKEAKGLFSVATAAEHDEIMNKFIADREFCQQTGNYVAEFVRENIGATNKILDFITH